jgi:competence protein ComEA
VHALSRILISFSFAGLIFAASSLLFTAYAQGNPQDPLPDGPGKETVLQACTVCHDESRFAAKRLSPDGWNELMISMQANGLQISDDDYNTVLNYLSTYLTAPSPKINVNKANADDLKKALDLTDKEAAAIVKYRTDHGDFKDWHDVASVDGVDPKKIEAKRDSLTF